MTLAIGSAVDAFDWAPQMGVVGQRLARRCWPGPLTLVSRIGADDGLASRLPEHVRRGICPQGTLGLRVPAHAAVLETLHQLPGPLVLTSANHAGKPDAVTADEVLRTLGDQLDLIIDDGPSHYGRPSSVVLVEGDSWRLLREGVVSSKALQQQAACILVFVCTGNTCRSPLAEALGKKLLADRLKCRPHELQERGFVIRSAGISAIPGGAAATEAIEAAREFGADLTTHASQPLTMEIVEQADYLVAMTRGHLLAIIHQFPRLGCRPRLLRPDGKDVADPIGCDQQTYRECARQIMTYLEQLLPEVQRR
jgi:protein-tyrosine phosphatase